MLSSSEHGTALHLDVESPMVTCACPLCGRLDCPFGRVVTRHALTEFENAVAGVLPSDGNYGNVSPTLHYPAGRQRGTVEGAEKHENRSRGSVPRAFLSQQTIADFRAVRCTNQLGMRFSMLPTSSSTARRSAPPALIMSVGIRSSRCWFGVRSQRSAFFSMPAKSTINLRRISLRDAPADLLRLRFAKIPSLQMNHDSNSFGRTSSAITLAFAHVRSPRRTDSQREDSRNEA